MIKLPTKLRLISSVVALPTIAALLSTSAFGQDELTEDDVYELSPFVIDSEGDEGYTATNTMAGTRLNAKLGDIGAAISVVTKDFMRDVGSDDMETLLTYTAGTESVGMSGNLQGANVNENPGQVREERTNARQQSNTRIRGLARADLTKDLFITDAPFDGYNIERVTINRGANAALFGLGSPGGILDAGLKKASFHDFYELQTKFDNFGTERYTIDINKVLIKDKLAIRIAGLDEHIEWEQNGTYEDDVRFYANVLFQPLKNTIIRGTYTTGSINAARPNTSPPGDLISAWMDAGQPLWDGITDRYYASIADYQNGNPIAMEQSNNLWHVGSNPDYFGNNEMNPGGGRRLTVIFPDPNSATPGGYNGSPQGMQTQISDPGGSVDGWPGGVTTTWRAPQDMRNVWQNPVGTSPGALGMSSDMAAFYKRPVVTDRGMFDYREEVYGTMNKQEQGDITHMNVALEQTFLEGDLGFEAAFDDQTYSDDFIKYSSSNTISMDINLTLADGTPNPNVGRAFVGGNAFAEPQVTERETMRATGYYKFDFAEKVNEDNWLSKLGRHVITGSWSKQKIDQRQETHMAATTGQDWALYTEGRADRLTTGSLDRAPMISYVSDSLIGISSTSDFNIGGVNVMQRIPDTLNDVIFWNAANALTTDFGLTTRANIGTKVANMDRGTQTFTFREHKDDPGKTWTWGGRGTYSEVDSIVAIAQSHFLNEHLVTTFSWRSDDLELYSYGTLRAEDGEQLHYGFQDIPEDPALTVVGKETTSYSIVAHSPEFINKYLPGDTTFSVHYNDSSNFNASSFRKTIYGDPIPQQEGTTKDWGITIHTLNNKLTLKANWYEAQQTGASTNPVGRPNRIWMDLMSWNTPEEIAAAGITAPPQSYLDAFEFEKTGETNDITIREFLYDGMGNMVMNPDGTPVINETIKTVDVWNSRNPQQNSIETAVGSTVSEGMELEIIWNPIKNWRILANATRAEAKQIGIAALEQEYLASRLPQWLDPAIGGTLYLNGARQTLTTNDDGAIIGIEQNRDNLLFDQVDGQLHNNAQSEVNNLNKATLFDGLATPELREWRYNIITNYEFTDRFGEVIDRIGIGGAIRWESASFLGTGLKRDETDQLVPDLGQIYEGDTNTRVDIWITYKQDFDKWGISWRSRLGVSDLFSDHGLIATAANPDGSYGQFRIEPPRTFSWTNTISF